MEVLKIDLAQDMDIFLHTLPSLPVFNDGGIKRAWNLVVGMVPHQLLTPLPLPHLPNRLRQFLKAMGITDMTTNLELVIKPVWPYVVGGYVASILLFFYVSHALDGDMPKARSFLSPRQNAVFRAPFVNKQAVI